MSFSNIGLTFYNLHFDLTEISEVGKTFGDLQKAWLEKFPDRCRKYKFDYYMEAHIKQVTPDVNDKEADFRYVALFPFLEFLQRNSTVVITQDMVKNFSIHRVNVRQSKENLHPCIYPASEKEWAVLQKYIIEFPNGNETLKTINEFLDKTIRKDYDLDETVQKVRELLEVHHKRIPASEK